MTLPTFSTSFDDDTTCVGKKFLDGSIRDGDTDTDETLGTERDEGDTLPYIRQGGVVVDHVCDSMSPHQTDSWVTTFVVIR